MRSESLLRKALIGLALAVPLWSFVFRSKRGNFWTRMTFGAGGLGLYALVARPELLDERPQRRDLAPGLLSAAGLYCIFQIGDRMARRIMPSGAEDISSVYELRTLAPVPLIAGLLVSVIGPSEELFWRGLVQAAFVRRMGKARGTLAAAAAYGAVHLVTGNLTLTAAATTAGSYWGAEYALRERLRPLIVSHILWDVWIFLMAPTPGASVKDGRKG
jgi:membrane protease YdiL (CAAX protease family)